MLIISVKVCSAALKKRSQIIKYFMFRTTDSIDCGITALRCCNTTGCQKLGNKKTFLTILVLCGIAQGATESYFRISAKQAALAYGYDPQIIGESEKFH